MESSHILIDTSILIEHLRKRNKRNSTLYHLIDTHVLYTATITEFELFCGATDERKRQDLQDILPLCQMLPLTSDIARQAGTVYQHLKQKNEIIDIQDILIAATAMTNELPVMTLNTEHFRRIDGLSLLPLPTRSER